MTSEQPNPANNSPFTIHHSPFNTLEETIGYRFRNPALLEQALVHRSYLHEYPDHPLGSNERLEFLGDAVLGYLSAYSLFISYPDKGEGELSELRAALIRRENLAHWAAQIRLGDYLYMSRGEESAGGRSKARVLANAFEALLGAMLLDGGLEAVTNFLSSRLREIEQAVARQTNYKGLLQQMVQASHKLTPAYHIVSSSGPDSDKQFVAEVRLPGQEQPLGSGVGRNKQLAEQAAAYDALMKRQADTATAPPTEQMTEAE